ncbi:MAG: hypothetical protein V9H69_24785 [Anaerolineae bacterium]
MQLELPGAADLRSWEFGEPLDEGSGDYPPRLEDEQIKARLLTWLRIRVAAPPTAGIVAPPVIARLTWLGINAAPVRQAVSVANEPLGSGNGEPDQAVTLANTPVIGDYGAAGDAERRWKLAALAAERRSAGRRRRRPRLRAGS